jgi:uncharacterized Ntn-hydrolase superfamily protein
MKKIDLFRRYLALVTVVLCLSSGSAYATFSIVAVDTATGAVGGAGASCINGSDIINDMIESIGAVHTQSWWLAGNQNNAHTLLADGLSPDSIISWLEANDIEGQPELRQYGVVTLAGQGASASYTGWANSPWAGHITGPGYAIQGNILLGPEIIQDMEIAYLTTDGPLEDKLMAALQAANVPGADSRCLPNNKPALSAFVKVVRPGDGEDYYLDLVVASAPGIINPITRVQELYDIWKSYQQADAELSTAEVSPVFLPALGEDSALVTVTPLNQYGEEPTEGAEVSLWNTGLGTLSPVTDNGDGTHTAYVFAPTDAGWDTIHPSITAGGQTVAINQRPDMYYYACGDSNMDQDNNIGDAVYLINHIFKGSSPPWPYDAGDANCDDAVNVGDVVYIIAFVFKGGPDPCCP